MSLIDIQSYVPVLRLKEGEYKALPDLAQDVATRILPHFILAPPTERDPEKKRILTPDEIANEGGLRVARYWPLRPCLLDARFIINSIGDISKSHWFSDMFRAAKDAGAHAIPVLSSSDLCDSSAAEVARTLGSSDGVCAFRINSDDLGNFRNTRLVIHNFMLALRVKPKDVIIILDISDADLDSPEIVAEMLIGYLEQIMEIGLWQKVVVEATSYPESNPAKAGGDIVLPRNEWVAWKHATNLDKKLIDYSIFGDFGPDSSKFEFSSGKSVRAIRHYRYSAKDCWFVVRGQKDQADRVCMPLLASKIVENEHFAGRDFSKADDRLFLTARKEVGPGNPTTWRQINVGHHLTRVVSDIGGLSRYKIRKIPISKYEQQSLPIS